MTSAQIIADYIADGHTTASSESVLETFGDYIRAMRMGWTRYGDTWVSPQIDAQFEAIRAKDLDAKVGA